MSLQRLLPQHRRLLLAPIVPALFVLRREVSDANMMASWLACTFHQCGTRGHAYSNPALHTPGVQGLLLEQAQRAAAGVAQLLGTCVLKARFDKGAKELSVSLFQVRLAHCSAGRSVTHKRLVQQCRLWNHRSRDVQCPPSPLCCRGMPALEQPCVGASEIRIVHVLVHGITAEAAVAAQTRVTPCGRQAGVLNIAVAFWRADGGADAVQRRRTR